MTQQAKIKRYKKRIMTKEIKALFNHLDDVKLYIMRPLIEKIVKTHFSKASPLLIYYVCIYALALYDVHKMELKQEKNKRLLRVLENAKKDVDKFIANYELSQIDMLEIKDLPF